MGPEFVSPKVTEQNPKLMDFKVTKSLLDKFGYTDDCPGCLARFIGTEHRLHTAECRRRIEAEIQKDDTEKERIKQRARGAEAVSARSVI